MIEYHGWAIIRESFNEDEESVSSMDNGLQLIRTEIDKMDYTNEFYQLRAMNGNYHLTIEASHNHRSEHIIEFFNWISKTAPGSYGLLYIFDDEDYRRGNENQFKVWRMKKGQVDELDDIYLSPYFPTVENPSQ
jgi:hypothetical protein